MSVKLIYIFMILLLFVELFNSYSLVCKITRATVTNTVILEQCKIIHCWFKGKHLLCLYKVEQQGLNLTKAAKFKIQPQRSSIFPQVSRIWVAKDASTAHTKFVAVEANECKVNTTIQIFNKIFTRDKSDLLRVNRSVTMATVVPCEVLIHRV